MAAGLVGNWAAVKMVEWPKAEVPSKVFGFEADVGENSTELVVVQG